MDCSFEQQILAHVFSTNSFKKAKPVPAVYGSLFDDSCMKKRKGENNAA